MELRDVLRQQRFLSAALDPRGAGPSAAILAAPLRSMDEFEGAAFRVDYTQPGGFQWCPDAVRLGYPTVVPAEPGPDGRLALLPLARGRTQEEALQAARDIDPAIREGLMRIDSAHLEEPTLPTSPVVPRPDEIRPTEFDLWILYFLGPGSRRPNLTRNLNHNFYQTRRGWE